MRRDREQTQGALGATNARREPEGRCSFRSPEPQRLSEGVDQIAAT